MLSFQATDPKLFFSKKDRLDPRLGDLVKPELSPHSVVVLGYPDDEGIQLNGGRTGASEGPREIRTWLYKQTPHPRRQIKALSDLGDLKLKGTLDQRHEAAANAVEDLLKKGHQVLSLGGGNDYAYCDGIGFLKNFSEKPLIINVDAHLDVRDMSKGPSSGTPFYRLLESPHDFDFLEFGIQTTANARAHYEYVEGRGGHIITMDELLDSPQNYLEYVLEATGDLLLKPRPTFLAIDIDAFTWSAAPGASASWPLGLEPQKFAPFFQYLLKRLDVKVLGIYEVSPKLDPAGGTAKLAAQLAHSFLHHV